MLCGRSGQAIGAVSLFTREWIEIPTSAQSNTSALVSLFTREWIEIGVDGVVFKQVRCLPLYEGVD